jgi:type I restriction enzyme S subunit
MSELPEGWVSATIADVTLPFDTVDPKKSPNERFSYIDIGCIDNNTQTIGEIKQFEGKNAPSRARRVVKAGDTLFSTVRTYLKNIALVPDEYDGDLTSTGVAVLRPAQGISSDYLFRWVCSQYFIAEISQAQDGTMYPAVTDADVSSGCIPVPPTNEQRRIVAKLDRLFARTSRARADLGHIPQLIERYKQAILRKAFSGELTADWRRINADTDFDHDAVYPIPDSQRPVRKQKPKGFTNRTGVNFPDLPATWRYKTIQTLYEQGWLIDYADGNHGSLYPRKEDFCTPGVFFVTATDLIDGKINIGSVQKLGETKARALRKGWAQPGDVLFSHNATVGRVAMSDPMEEPFLLGTSVTYYRVNPNALNASFMYWALQSPVFVEQYSSVMEQTTRNQVPITRQAFLELPVPPLDEQIEIGKRIHRAMSWIDTLGDQKGKASKLLENLDARLLAKAFSGNLVPQDPNDEPASELLDRIRTERAARSNNGRNHRRK